MPDWDDLRFFLAVYRSGSLTAAARVLGCSQPTVGRRIAALAGTYGAALLESRGGRYDTTTVGRRVLARAERIEREIGGIADDIDRVDERAQGSVRVSVPEGAGLLLVAPRLADFRREYPDIDLVLVGEHAIADLGRREADMAIRVVRPRQQSLVARRLAVVPFSLYASTSYLTERPRAGDGVLPTEDLVTLHEDLTRSPDFAWLRRHLPDARVRVRVRSPLGIRAAVLAGAGVGLLAPYLADEPTLRRLVGPPPLLRDMYLVYPRAYRRTARVQIVSRFLAECLKGLQ